jgi:hypothetical protein
MLRDADHHSPKSCNQFYFLWYTSQELCSLFLFFTFMQCGANQTVVFVSFLFSLFALPNQTVVFAFSIGINRRYFFLAHFPGDNTDDLW